MDINERLQQEQMTGGAPKVNPDEQNRYLGTFRERVMAAVKVSQVDDANVQAWLRNLMQENSEGKLLINQALLGDDFTAYLTMATSTNHPFTLLSDSSTVSKQADPVAVVLAADHAVNFDQIYYN
ncbi:DUF1694 domain-containing protein [Eupransor demetentiae]|uniref:DUF2278 family (YueI) n=1 Tax=Eupransor demetentiae TaxID=3109584 RepID=A0ABM9N6E6_9LACO|nr:DUF2278 family (YueI) [Lactobacillaceae bacterium LMG 33000]